MANPEPTTLVCFALKEEASPFEKFMANPAGCLVTGIGRKNAEAALGHFLENPLPSPPALVLTCGFAGGLNPDLKTGDVVFEVRHPPSAIENKLLAAGAKPVRFFCADRIATTVAEKEKLRRETGADAVEMESEAIQEVCRQRGIACATVRVISDTALENLPLDFNRLSKRDQSLDFGKLAWAVAKSPGKIGGLLRLQKTTRRAAEELARVLVQII